MTIETLIQDAGQATEDLANRLDIMEMDVADNTKSMARLDFDLRKILDAVRLIASKDPRIAGRVESVLRAEPANSYNGYRTVVFEEPELPMEDEEETTSSPISWENLDGLPLQDRIERVLHYRKRGGRRSAAKTFVPPDGWPAKVYGWRSRVGLTRREASLVTGLTDNQFYCIENGKTLKYENIQKLIDLGCVAEDAGDEG